MANFERQTVNYTTDEGKEVAIQLVYFNNVAIDPDTRLDIGAFDSENECGLITPRRRLKPRKVVIEVGEGEDTSRLDIYVKTRSDYFDLIENPDSPSTGRVVAYEGEKSSICTPSN